MLYILSQFLCFWLSLLFFCDPVLLVISFIGDVSRNEGRSSSRTKATFYDENGIDWKALPHFLELLQKGGYQNQLVCPPSISLSSPLLLIYSLLDEEPPDVDDIFCEIDEADEKLATYREYAVNMSCAQLWWLAEHIEKKIEERRADAQTWIEAAVKVSSRPLSLSRAITLVSLPTSLARYRLFVGIMSSTQFLQF